MLANPWLLLLGTIAAFALFWSLPRERTGARQIVLAGVSALLVFAYSPGGFLGCLYLTIIPLVSQAVFRRIHKTWLFWAFIALALVPMVGFRLLSEQHFIITFGLAFATVKALGLVFTAYGGRQRLRFVDVALLIYFFPLFTVGPVERLDTFRAENFGKGFDFQQAVYGGYRIATGLFLIMFVCNQVLDPIRSQWYGRSLEDILTFDRLDSVGFMLASFFYTYINFVGFSSVAIGLSRLFNLKVIENFDRPLLVSNLAEFWKRYHISMGNWINQFIFFPVVLWLRKDWATYVGTIVAFIFFGMWHAFNLNYLLWGIGNGVVVAAIQYAKAKKVFPLVKEPGIAQFAVRLGGGAMTILYISWLQTFANLESFKAGLELTRVLLFG